MKLNIVESKYNVNGLLQVHDQARSFVVESFHETFSQTFSDHETLSQTFSTVTHHVQVFYLFFEVRCK